MPWLVSHSAGKTAPDVLPTELAALGTPPTGRCSSKKFTGLSWSTSVGKIKSWLSVQAWLVEIANRAYTWQEQQKLVPVNGEMCQYVANSSFPRMANAEIEERSVSTWYCQSGNWRLDAFLVGEDSRALEHSPRWQLSPGDSKCLSVKSIPESIETHMSAVAPAIVPIGFHEIRKQQAMHEVPAFYMFLPAEIWAH